MQIMVYTGVLIKEGVYLMVKHGDKLYNISTGSEKVLESFKEGDQVNFHLLDSGDWVTLWCPRCDSFALSTPKQSNMIELPEVISDRHALAPYIEVADRDGKRYSRVKSLNTKTLMAEMYVQSKDPKLRGTTEFIQLPPDTIIRFRQSGTSQNH